MKKISLFAILIVISGGVIALSSQIDDSSNDNSLNSTSILDNAAKTAENKLDDKPISLPAFMRNSTEWAKNKLDSMSLREKIGQSFMVGVRLTRGEQHVQLIDRLITDHKIGGVIFFKGSVANTKKTIQRFQAKSDLPLLVGMDAEWGSGMRLPDGEKFPYQLTIGAASDYKSTEIIGEAMGVELRELGVNFTFSPVADVNTNPDNPIIGFRSFGENPVTVAKNTAAMIKGIQQYNVLTCMKHFPGHGDTEVDSHKKLPLITKSEKELNRIDWLPYKQGRRAGADAIMVAHLNVPSLDSTGTPSSLSPIVIKKYIREQLDFDGLVVSDALNMKALTNTYGNVEIVRMAYLAGNDILLCPSRTKVKESIDAIVQAINEGKISMEEVNKKAMRILRAKYYSTGKKDKQFPELVAEKVQFAEATIYQKALTVIKNNNSDLPVKNVSGENLIINIGEKGTSFNAMAKLYTDAKVVDVKNGNDAWTIYKFSLPKYNHVYINVYASSPWPGSGFHYPTGWKNFLKNLPEEPKTYVTLFGNPYAVQSSDIFKNVDAVILAFQNSKLGQNRAAQLIFGGIQSTTKLSITLSADYQEGFGIETAPASRLKFTVPMEFGLSNDAFNKIDSIALDGIKQRAYPSCQIVVAKDGKVIYRKAFGYFTYDEKQQVNNQTLYDLASITKIGASTLSLMYLDDHNKFSLDSTLGTYLGALTNGTAYSDLLMRDIVTHQARLKPWIPFYTETLKEGYPDPSLYSKSLQGNKTAIVAKDLYIDKNYEDSMYQIIVHTPLQSVKRYKYSDLSFYFGKRIIEKQTGKQLEEFVQKKFYEPMGLTSMGYNPLNRFDLAQITPTEKDDYFRHRLVHGHVHDMGAAMQDGVGGHAGLFSNATDLAALMQLLLNKGVYGGKRYLSADVIERYTACQFCPSNRRGAGFDKPVLEDVEGSSSKLASPSSFGHTGFTGTISWADPENGLVYVFLSNRVYPSGENWKISRLDIRTKIQSVAYEVFQKSNEIQ